MKKGHFNDDEDIIIRSALEGHHSYVVDEAIWNELAKNLNRDKVSLVRRWRNLRKGKENAERKDGEGQKVTTDSKMREVKRVGKYDEDEDEIIRRRFEENSGIVCKGFWDELAKELNREEASLRLRWSLLRKGEMKKGYFDADEDKIICEKVKGLFYIVEPIWDNLAILLNRYKKDVKRRWASLNGEKTLKQERRFSDKDDKLIRQILQGADIDVEEKLDEAALLLCRDKWAIRLRWQRIRNMEEVIDKANEDNDNDYDNDDDNDDDDDDDDDDNDVDDDDDDDDDDDVVDDDDDNDDDDVDVDEL